jgi:predicted small lipoprotein YifL
VAKLDIILGCEEKLANSALGSNKISTDAGLLPQAFSYLTRYNPGLSCKRGYNQSIMKTFALLMLCCIALSGCGQKGPLVPPPAVQAANSASQ